MKRFCYCSKILPGKSDVIRQHWKDKEANKSAAEISFWNHLKMTGFESWLQSTPQGDFMIHCLEGESLQQIFKGLREQIAAGNPVALKLHAFYLDVLGKDYRLPDVEPNIECLLDISLPNPSSEIIKKGFAWPLLPHKEQAHRKFREAAMGAKRGRHVASMQAFGIFYLTSYLQHMGKEKWIVVYNERQPSASQRPNSPEWEQIAAELMDHTGLNYAELSCDVEWLTQPHIHTH